jgi:hypothetical protein
VIEWLALSKGNMTKIFTSVGPPAATPPAANAEKEEKPVRDWGALAKKLNGPDLPGRHFSGDEWDKSRSTVQPGLPDYRK